MLLLFSFSITVVGRTWDAFFPSQTWGGPDWRGCRDVGAFIKALKEGGLPPRTRESTGAGDKAERGSKAAARVRVRSEPGPAPKITTATFSLQN